MNHIVEEFYPCPCCGESTIDEPGSYEICDVCGWEDDPIQSSDPYLAGGANQESLDTSRKNWLKRKSGL
ncbi:CPCC family cysteine-rich protein [Noviherbaspirillum aerium]|uniref:CPCC family cysteine-rich protein n=1 Tax=Noviherbaspirillum aerium TaxID=2588497 RepID=UPI00124E640E|nr:CPCC family cysteine-rich protein [Noviherbaspirillum aerium]